MKTKEELSALKEELDTMKSKLAELSEDELTEVTGGFGMPSKSTDEKYVILQHTDPKDIGHFEFHFYK